MKILSDELLQEIVRRLVAEFDPEQIILFGSHAWGTPDEDSDVDHMVIVSERDERPAARATRGHRALRGLDISKDVVVKTRHEFGRRLRIASALEARTVERGNVLYCRFGEAV